MNRRRTPLLCAIGFGIWSAVAFGSQSATPPALSAALRSHVQSERFDVVTSIRGLPIGVRDELQTLFGSRTLDIAEPGAPFQSAGRGGTSQLPIRRLASAACSPDFHCLVYYERGGSPATWRAALFRWTPAATQLEAGGVAPGGLKTVDDVRRAVLSGATDQRPDAW